MITKQDVLDKIELDYMIRIRRELHMYPELGFELPNTLALIRRELDAMGIEYTEEYGKSSITAFINKECRGFSIGLRADTDALPIMEENDVPYKSTIPGKMHACGHDVHTAALLGTAKALKLYEKELNCKVVLLFQAAEEGPGGARPMVADGICDEFDVIASCHVDNRFECGTIQCGRDAIFAATDGFVINFSGKTAHAAYPHEAADAMAMGVKAYTDIQFAFARCIDPFALRVVNVGMFSSGHSPNTVSADCTLKGTVRTYDEDIRNGIFEKMERIVQNAADTFGGTGTLQRFTGEQAMRNDPHMADLMLKAAAEVLGKENSVELKRPLMCAEDFIQYTKHRPSVYFFLGTGNKDKGIVDMTHSNRFDIDEKALAVAASVFSSFVWNNQNGINSL